MENACIVQYPPCISKTDGIKGKIKEIPEDFIVSEITPEKEILDPQIEHKGQLSGIEGLFLHFILVKNNIETEEAFDILGQLWGIPRNNFSFAGTKDKKALTGQRVSAWGMKNGNRETVKEINYPSIKTYCHSFRLHDIRLGDLWGNEFNITIRDIKEDEEKVKEKINKIITEVKNFGGVLNMFGEQRFGTTRPITHIVGKELLRGNIKEAIKVYIGKAFEDEPDGIKKIRSHYWNTEDASESYRHFPSYLKVEKELLHTLSVNSNNYNHAFNTLSRHLKKLFVHAYQSHLFNKYLTIRYNDYTIGFKTAMEGEKEINGKVCAPIIGGKIKELKGVTKTIYEKILEEENIDIELFKREYVEKLGVQGTYRPILVEPEDFQIISVEKDEMFENSVKAQVKFRLEKGSYATVILREIQKI